MGILEDKKTSRNLLITVLLLYFFAYFGRYSYYSTIVNMTAADGGFLTKTQTGTLSSVFYIFFAIGSLYSIRLCNKKYTYLILFVTAIGTALSNLGFYFSQSFVTLACFFSVNAICQSLMFTPIFTIINTNIQSNHRIIGVKYFSLLYPLARFFDNLMVVLSMLAGSYRYLYLFCFVTITLVALLWFFYWHIKVRGQYTIQEKQKANTVPVRFPEQMPLPQNTSDAEKDKENPNKDMKLFKLLLSTGFFVILAINLCRIALTHGPNTWVPTIIKETFGTTSLVAQTTTLVFPLLNILGIYLGILTLKKCKNEILVAGIYFCISALPFAGLLFMKDIGFDLTLALFCLSNIFSYSFFYVLNSRIAASYRKTNQLSIVTSILSFNGSIGFIISSYVFGALGDIGNWSVVISIWVIISICAGTLCFSIAKRWGNFQKK